MRLVSYIGSSGTRVGAFLDDDLKIIDLLEAAQIRSTADALFRSMMSLIEAGQDGLNSARDLVAACPPGAVVRTEDVRLVAPLPVPAQIRDFLSFEQHFANAMAMQMEVLIAQSGDPVEMRNTLEARGYGKIPPVWYERPIYYTTSRFLVSGPDEEICWPSYSRTAYYELDLAVIIVKTGRDITEDEAHSQIFGYTIYNDWSARDTQAKVMEGRLGPGRGKEFDQGVTLGPCIVTPDEIPDPYDLAMKAYVNGEQWSDGSSATMYHRFERCIAELSLSQTLWPGEVIGSGTVGTGCGLEQNRFLNDGDVVELYVEKIGWLRNRVHIKPA